MDDIDGYFQKLQKHVKDTERDADLAKVSYAALDSYQKSMKSKRLLEGDLKKIILAATSRHLGPYYIGTYLLLAMYNQFPEIEAVWRSLANSEVAYERWVAISVMRDERFPVDLVRELVENALNDKSSKVRAFAVELVLVRQLESLLPEVKRRATLEKDRKVIREIDWVLASMGQSSPARS